MTDEAIKNLVRPAVQAAMRAAVRYLEVHDLQADDGKLSDALRVHVKAKMAEGLADAKAALESRMPQIAEQTFLASMAQAGIAAAKEVGKPKVAGYFVGANGKAVCPGVVCKCGEGFCPAHGSQN